VVVFLHAEQSGEIKRQVIRETIRGFGHLLLPVSYDALHRPILCHIPLAQNGTPAVPEKMHAAQAQLAPGRLAGPKCGAAPGKPRPPSPGRPVSAKTAKNLLETPYFPLKSQVLA
jgi:hypothetical protein